MLPNLAWQSTHSSKFGFVIKLTNVCLRYSNTSVSESTNSDQILKRFCRTKTISSKSLLVLPSWFPRPMKASNLLARKYGGLEKSIYSIPANDPRFLFVNKSKFS